MRGCIFLIALFIGLFIGLSNAPVIAADVNAPVEVKLTIKSEVLRGDSAAWDKAPPVGSGGHNRLISPHCRPRRHV